MVISKAVKLKLTWISLLAASFCGLIGCCLFRVYRLPREIFTHMETSPLPVKGCKFELCSALMAIEQWKLLSVAHLLWHGISVYNGHLRGPVTLTPIAEHLAVELSLPVFTTYVCRSWDLNTQASACGANTLTHCATAAVGCC